MPTALRRLEPPKLREKGPRLSVPEDVQRIVGDGSPCFLCGTSGACRHRPWMVAS